MHPDPVQSLLGGLRDICVAEGALVVPEVINGDRAIFFVIEGKLERAGRQWGPGTLVSCDRSQDLRAVELTRLFQLSSEQVSGYLRALFGELDDDTRSELEQCITWVRLRAGESLYATGDACDAAYVVVYGRVRVDHDAGPGEWVGEMALLGHTTRKETAIALRDTHLVRISKEAFDAVVCRHPRVLLEMTRRVLTRFERAEPKAQHRKTFAVVTVHDTAATRWARDELARCVSQLGAAIYCTADDASRETGIPDAARAAIGGPHDLRVSYRLSALEERHRFVVYEADPSWTPWTERVVRQADEILYLVDASSSTFRMDIEDLVARTASSSARNTLILVQPARPGPYRETRRWLERRTVDRHHHIRIRSVSDVARVTRILTGRAIGLVLGGGGSRGYAHIGVVRAFEQLGIPIDILGGTSVGAVVALAGALEMSSRQMLEVIPPSMQAAFFDPTLPVVSLMSGKKAARAVNAVAAGADIEDLALPMFCMSTNLTRGEPVVHTRGSLELAVRASGSVPGILPPVPFDGDLLVDGGLSNNVPADVMAEHFGARVVAVDVIPEIDLRVSREAPDSGGFAWAWRRVNPLSSTAGMPDILSILVRSATASARGLSRQLSQHCDLYLRPAVSRWNVLDYAAAEPIADEGYRGTFDAISSWWARCRDWREMPS